MLRRDAQESKEINCNMNLLTLDMIPLIEKEIEPYDMISIVFLLYDTPNTALERLLVFQRVSKDIGSGGSNLLHDWVLHAQSRPTWRKEFVEALYTCQMYSIIRKIGISVPAVRNYYETTNETLIDPMKIQLYRLCENINKDNLYKFKKTLITYDFDVSDYESCEMILLHLMCYKFITLKNAERNSQMNIKELVKIIENFPDLHQFATDMTGLESKLSNEYQLNNQVFTSTPRENLKNQHSVMEENDGGNKYVHDFDEIYEEFNKLDLCAPVENIKHIKSDMVLAKDAYEIKDPQNIGVCLIINIENFHPSKLSIEGKVQSKALEDRKGSTNDKNALMNTMKNLNFDIVSRDNLDHVALLECIKDVIKYRVHENHSVFMLCILSHGTKGHIYAADSVKVKVEDIENLLDSDDALHLRYKPKLMILQACQVKEDESSQTALVADSPQPTFKYYIKKSDIIIYWATAPGYEAFRHEKMGSLFIQTLCCIIKDWSHKEHVNDLFTKVTGYVRKICVKLEREQLPKVEHTLSKKLYLQIPKL